MHLQCKTPQRYPLSLVACKDWGKRVIRSSPEWSFLLYITWWILFYWNLEDANGVKVFQNECIKGKKGTFQTSEKTQAEEDGMTLAEERRETSRWFS